MKQGEVRALLIEKETEEALHLLDMAHRSEHIRIEIDWEQSLKAAREAGARSWDVILLGIGLGGPCALEALDAVQASGVHSAIVVISDSSSRGEAVRTIRRGAEDFLIRSELTPSSFERALQFAMERQRAKAALRVAEADYRGLFENALEGVYRSSPEGKLLAANPSLVQMLGYDSMEEMLTIDLRDLYVNPEDREKWLDRVETRDEIRNSEAVLRRKDGQAVIVLETSRAVRAEDGRTLYFEGSLLDITERKRHERHLEYLVNHDSLTGLLSRRRFLQDLDREVERARRYESHGSLLLIDLDRFKEINDTLGHSVGDDVLVVVGRLLKRRLRRTDLVARLGGDEFAVLAPETGVVEAQTVAAALLDTLWNGAIGSDGQRHRIGASIGIASISLESTSSGEVLARADQAMYRAKSNGGRDCEVYAPAGDDTAPVPHPG